MRREELEPAFTKLGKVTNGELKVTTNYSENGINYDLLLQYVPHMCKDSILITMKTYKTKTVNKVQRAFHIESTTSLNDIMGRLILDIVRSNPIGIREIVDLEVGKINKKCGYTVFKTVTTDVYFRPGENRIQGMHTNRLALFSGTCPGRVKECDVSESHQELWYDDDWDTPEYLEYVAELRLVEAQLELIQLHAESDQLMLKARRASVEYVRSQNARPILVKVFDYLVNKFSCSC